MRARTTADDQPWGFWAVADASPHRTAVVDAGGGETSFGELRTRARAMSAGLRAHGLRRGDLLAVVLPNVPELLVAYLAAMESGLYFTPVNSHLTQAEIAHVLADSEAKAVLVHASLAEVSAAGVADAGIDPPVRLATPDADGFRPLRQLLDEHAGASPPPDDGGTGAVMMYTSGTTGRPKGVRRPLPEGRPDDVLGAAAALYCAGFGFPPGEAAHLVCGPLYHAGPLSAATSALHAGNTLVLMDRWTPQGCLERIERHRIASTQMVPTMFQRLLALPDEVRSSADVTSVRSVMHTGAPCPPHVKQRFMDWFGPVVYETYGGTESVATIATPRRWLQKPGTVGKAIHGVTVHIVDDEGHELPAGEAGAIYIENRNGSRVEYFKDPDKTEAMRLGDWVTLGDVGYLDDDGYLFLRDRTIDMIISGGVNIYPAEIESVLTSSELVVDVAVIGVPDDEWGERILAIVELADGVEASPDVERALLEHCDGQLARFKQPRSFEFVDELPRQPNGKLRKQLLRQPYWDAVGRAI